MHAVACGISAAPEPAFLQGTCTKGLSCTFAHGEEERAVHLVRERLVGKVRVHSAYKRE